MSLLINLLSGIVVLDHISSQGVHEKGGLILIKENNHVTDIINE